MTCPKCGSAVSHREDECENTAGQLYAFGVWDCSACGHAIYDSEDEYELPPDKA